MTSDASRLLNTSGVVRIDFLVDKKFIEILGEYYQEDAEAGTEIPETQVAEINKTKKRIITYKLYQ